MKEELLDVLCEPGTGASLHLKTAEVRNGQVWTGILRSESTGHEYPIHDGIPRFVPPTQYTESFGLQWNRFAQVQLDSANGASYSRRRFESETGWSRADLQGQWVLDAGCGSGRFAEIAADRGAKVIAFDYSSAIDAARRNLTRFDQVHYVQGNLLDPPLRRGSLPFIYSIGVLQHTPDPARSLRTLLELLCPGGRFALTIYGRRWYTKLYAKYLLRPITKRMRPETLLWMVERCMPILFPITDVLFRLPALGKLAQFTIPVATESSIGNVTAI